jgi:hypothetical protein
MSHVAIMGWRDIGERDNSSRGDGGETNGSDETNEQ